MSTGRRNVLLLCTLAYFTAASVLDKLGWKVPYVSSGSVATPHPILGVQATKKPNFFLYKIRLKVLWHNNHYDWKRLTAEMPTGPLDPLSMSPQFTFLISITICLGPLRVPQGFGRSPEP